MGSGMNGIYLLFLVMLFFSLSRFQFLYAVSNITSSIPLSSGQSLTSPGGIFELGFFSPNNPQNQYVAIWSKNFIPRIVVWVANREKPVTVPAANLKISNNGNLILVDGNNSVVWSSNTNFASTSSIAELLDDGNFVMKDVISGDILWESFKHPGNTMLANSTVTYNLKTGEKATLTSWKSYVDPSPGNYVAELVPQIPPQIFIWKGSIPYWRSGPWSKAKLVGVPEMDVSYLSSFSIHQNVKEGTGYYSFDSNEDSVLSYIFISPEGSLKVMWNRGNGWDVNWEAPDNLCDFYGACGPFGICMKSERPKCECLKGFVPKSETEWKRGNWTDGCVRRRELLCEKNSSTSSMQNKNQDMFYRVVGTNLPDHYESVAFWDIVEVCHKECLNNCSCLAYAFVDGIGCLVWKQELLDTVKFSSGGEDLFIRLVHYEFGNKNRTKMLVASLTVVSIIMILGAVIYGSRWRRSKQCETSDRSEENSKEHGWRTDLKEQDVSNLHFFDIHAILMATDNFSTSNKLGQGGFGPVYKGKLQDGKEVAVKRLSSSSGQGMKEFVNEIILISKLQHRNLVRLMGCCIEKEEKILIYEFMTNKSLDGFLFDASKKLVLDWAKRYNIIQGIASGLLYLHRDSCLRVIHRDLKASNILLDKKMNPKISDFGLARMFEVTQDLASTHRVVGTLGYMSPEYAMGGMFSEKSDVYSFGIMLLEIIIGKKTTSFSYDEQSPSLLTYAWESWCQSKGLNLVDQALGDSYSPSEVRRCIHISLLCVQDHVVDRPNMFQVVSMLNCETELPEPNQPTFTFQKASNRVGKSPYLLSICQVTESTIDGR